MARKRDKYNISGGNMKSKNPDISIFSLDTMIDLITRRRTNYNIVSIRSSNFPDSEYSAFEEYCHNYKDIITEVFDDIESPDPGFKVVEPEQIERILNWSKVKKNIAVHCTAGISRSSAIAYLIACTRMPPAKAIRILDGTTHSPNDLVLYYGIKILGNFAVYDEYLKWRRKADALPQFE